MLGFEEGQLKAVYACYGSVAAEAQFFEDAVRSDLIPKVRTRDCMI